MFSKKFWDEQSESVTRLRQLGTQKFFDSIPYIEQAFWPADRWLRCIDEGCPGGVHLTGSGILLGLDEAVKVAEAAGVTAITSHEECGAAKLWATEHGKDAARGDDYGKEFAAGLAKRLGISYVHLPMAEMARPAGLHIARVVYYDGTVSFDPSRVPGLPPGFAISRRYLTPEYAKRECEIAVRMAFGDHGFGKLFTQEKPLLIIVVGQSAEMGVSLDQLRGEVEPLALKHGGRVIVDSLVAPVVQVVAGNPAS